MKDKIWQTIKDEVTLRIEAEPSLKPYLNYLLDNGAAEQVNVKWGKGHRNVIIIGGKKYQYKGGDEFNKNLKKKITSLYISMSEKSSKKHKFYQK